MSATGTQQLHSWPVSRALARSAAEDSQNASAEQLWQFGAAIQAVHCTRWVGVVLCTCVAVTIRWLWADYLAGPSSGTLNKPSVPVPTWLALTSTVPGPPPLARGDRSRRSSGRMQAPWFTFFKHSCTFYGFTHKTSHVAARARNINWVRYTLYTTTVQYGEPDAKVFHRDEVILFAIGTVYAWPRPCMARDSMMGTRTSSNRTRTATSMHTMGHSTERDREAPV